MTPNILSVLREDLIQISLFRWKPSEETVVLDGSIKNDEAIVGTSPQQEGSDSLISFTFPPTLIVGAVYKVNVYSVVDAANQVKIFKYFNVL